MLQIAITIVVLLGLLAGVVFILALRRPDTFEVSRAIDIAAPPQQIFPLINNLASLNTWNPFNADPTIVGTYSGPTEGIGASYAFASPRAGTGRIQIVDSAPPASVTMRLVMSKPFACNNQVVYALAPTPNATRVTWSMSGKSSLIPRLMCVFMNPDRMVGSMFEKGLVDLKALAETPKVM